MKPLARVVPWGRSFREYERMFRLDPGEGPILGCADGPASFNAESSERGMRVVSCDPLYRYPGPQIRVQIEAALPEVEAQTRQKADRFVWSEFSSIEDLCRRRMDAMDRFLRDFQTASTDGRYIAGELPGLPFRDSSFALCLCSHFLFLYSGQLSAEFHTASLLEMMRIANEVRVFPLVTLEGTISPHLDSAVEKVRRAGHAVHIERVPYEFVRGADQMMRIRRR